MKRDLKNKIRYLPFLILILLSIIMGIATFVEKNNGSDYVYDHIYASWWFTLLWASVAGLSLFGLIKGKMYRNLPLTTIHLSLILILIGALCTKLYGIQGYVILTENISCSRMQTDTGEHTLPFEITLEHFRVEYYPGTDAPSDYVSKIRITNKEKGVELSEQVSMNNICSYRGYRFYQSSFDDNGKRSGLSINRDPAGISITYFGYGLFIWGMIWFLFSGKNCFRKLLSHPLIKQLPIIGLLLLVSGSIHAGVFTNDSLSVNKIQAKQFGKLLMLNNGRITPVKTFAHDFTLKLTGKPSFGYLNDEQFLMSWLFFTDKWQHIKIFPVEHPTLQKELNVSEFKRAAYSDFFDSHGNCKLNAYQTRSNITGSKNALQKEAEKLNDKIQLIVMLHSGNLLKLYPYEIDKQIYWFSPTETIPCGIMPVKDSLFVKKSLLMYYEAIQNNTETEAFEALEYISEFQKINAKDVLPSESRQKAERLYIDLDLTSKLFKINLTLGIICLFTLFISNENKQMKKIILFFRILLLISFAAQTFSIGLRSYAGGRLPFANGFETMLLIAWSSMFAAVLFGKKINLILPFGFLLSGCVLLVAHLGMMNPQITPLVPVLSSPLLSIHVSLIMLSYTLFGFIFLNSFISVLSICCAGKKNGARIIMLTERNKIIGLICLYPSVLLLGAGIFIGAVWANISWGRYWGWDPKEVWALITFLIYSLPVHQKKLPVFSNPFYFHLFGLFAFSSVLMTYFGVNYFLGGMHSYAGEGGFENFFIILGIVVGCLILLCLSAGRKYKAISIDNKKIDI